MRVLSVAGRFRVPVLLSQAPRHHQLSDVVYQAIQFPLGVHLDFAAVAEPVETQVVSDIGKYWFHRSHPAAVVVPPAISVKPLDHLLVVGVRRVNDRDAFELRLLAANTLRAQ